MDEPEMMAGAVSSAAKPRKRSGKMQPQERHLRARDRLRSRDRLKGQPQEGQHSADAKRRDPGPTAPGERYNMKREGWKPNGGDARSCAAPFTTARSAKRKRQAAGLKEGDDSLGEPARSCEK